MKESLYTSQKRGNCGQNIGPAIYTERDKRSEWRTILIYKKNSSSEPRGALNVVGQKSSDSACDPGKSFAQ